MRYEKEVYFQKITAGDYDESTGNHNDDSVTETMRYASVMDTKTETMLLVYGKITQGSLTIQIQNHYDEAFDRIRVDDAVYSVDDFRKLRTKHVFVVSEVQ